MNSPANSEITKTMMDAVILPVMDIVKINPDLPTPKYATDGSNALDLYANLKEKVVLKPKQSQMIGTGIKANIPNGLGGLLIPRSGKGSKGMKLKNTVGLIDSDYHGEILANVKNDDETEDLIIEPGERFVQLALAVLPQVIVNIVDELPESQRGEGGFGSTGKHA